MPAPKPGLLSADMASESMAFCLINVSVAPAEEAGSLGARLLRQGVRRRWRS